MTGTDWHGSLSSEIEFMYTDAAHHCKPDRQLYASLVQRGLYDHGDGEQYFTFGLGTKGACVSGADGFQRVEQSVAHAERSLRDPTTPCTAIGGICEGACIAAVGVRGIQGMAHAAAARLGGVVISMCVVFGARCVACACSG